MLISQPFLCSDLPQVAGGYSGGIHFSTENEAVEPELSASLYGITR